MSTISMDEELTPPEITEMANDVRSNLLPYKSKKLYMDTYAGFLDWCSKKNVKTYTENVFLAFFSEKSKISKSSSMWSYYSMLKAVFNVEQGIDISKFKKLTAFLKRCSENYKPKKSKIFTLDEIEKFIYEAPDKEFLLMKVVALFGISGACRRQELYNLETEDIQDVGSALLIRIREAKNKVPRTFTVVDNDRNPSFLEIYRKYASLRPPTDNKKFFVFYNNNKCTKQNVGINQFGKIPCLIAKYLNLSNPELYTGHSFRRSSASLLADSGADISAVKRLGGWKSSTVAEGYIENSVENKKETSRKIFGIEEVPSCSTSLTKFLNQKTENVPNFVISNINNCPNLTINVNVHNNQ